VPASPEQAVKRLNINLFIRIQTRNFQQLEFKTMKQISFFLMILLACSCNDSTRFAVFSPGGELGMTVGLKDTFCYSVEFKGSEKIHRAPLGFILKEGQAWSGGLRCLAQKADSVDETFTLPFGKRKTVRNHYNSLTLTLQEKKAPHRKIGMEIRVYREAVAFRYSFPGQDGSDSIRIREECTHFTLTDNPVAWYLSWPDYHTNHEALFTRRTIREAPFALLDLPFLMEFPDTVWMAIAEANLGDYAAMYLSKSQVAGQDLFTCLAGLPGHGGVRVTTAAGRTTPWRIILVADQPGDLMESDVITCLSEPSRISDLSWMNPGKSTWHWWNGTVLENVKFKPGMNFETMKHYIDFCARNGIPYHALVEANGFWYENPDGNGWNPGPTADVTKPVPALQMDRLIRYARDKGVGLRLWVHWKALNLKMEEAFRTYHEWGIKGLMVDFMDRDDQEMVAFYHRCLELAAKYQLHIQFHGALIPTGMRRTYPNLFTSEAVLNTEWFGTCNPEHDVTVPFTRMLAGPMDYHLGGFHSVKQTDRCRRGQIYGTRCHSMAMYVVYESYLQLLCDYPEAYEGKPGFDFVREVPTTWDDMKVVNAAVGDYVTVARRSGDDWYIGTMTDWTPRDLDIPLDFLPAGTFEARVWEDAPDSGENPDHLTTRTIPVTNRDTLQARLAPGGGQVVRISGKSL
jgi:alpha-glucosidase